MSGLAKVLSITVIRPSCRAKAMISPSRGTRTRGLVIVSTRNSRVCACGQPPRLRLLGVDERVAPPEFLGVVGDEVVGAAVQAVAAQEVVARTERGQQAIVSAAVPEEVATAACAPSKAASLSWRYVWEGCC
ncbi:MAG: hypothetical protein ACRDYA_21835 [Egibacteraceae bacterium]